METGLTRCRPAKRLFSFGDYGAFIDETSRALGSSVDVITRRSLTDCESDRRILEDEVRVL